ncbi:MAG TPA: type II secretion system protein GspN, partial [Nitrospiria bacterium]|nr:type II secretion system protein GspN [Nitrospiria bacterium]
MFPRRLEKKENPSRWITTLGYLSAGVVAVTLFVYLTFPWDKLSLWAQAQVENKTGMDLKVGKSEVKFPFHMVWKDVTFSWSGPGSSQVKAERLSVEWPLRAILGRRLEVKFLARLFGGEFRGLLASENGEKGTVY